MDAFLISILLSGVAMVLCLFFSERIRPSPSSSLRDFSRASRELEGVLEVMLPLPHPADALQPDQALIWSTQIPALRFVSDREPRGAYYTPLRLIYIESARRYPEIYDGCTFQNWVEFYVRRGLLHFEDDAIHITAAGRELLGMLERSTPSESAAQAHLGTRPNTRLR